tara:strand:- start:628 stop:735 length:108 start_codon:yes stop_codon:yes gene_type:complete
LGGVESVGGEVDEQSGISATGFDAKCSYGIERADE